MFTNFLSKEFEYRAADRGLYNIRGTFDINAPRVQVLTTPTGTPITLSSGLFPYRYTIDSTLEAAPDPNIWINTQARLENQGFNVEENFLTAPAGMETPIFDTSKISNTFSNITGYFKNASQTAIFLGIAVFALVFIYGTRGK